MVAHGLEETQGQCTFDFKTVGWGLWGEDSRKSLVSAFFELKLGIKNAFLLQIWPRKIGNSWFLWNFWNQREKTSWKLALHSIFGPGKADWHPGNHLQSVHRVCYSIGKRFFCQNDPKNREIWKTGCRSEIGSKKRFQKCPYFPFSDLGR